jgi:anti-sigma regulatory factor (Ser/Thr protein kinase)
VAVLAARLLALPDRLQRRWPADARVLRDVRDVMRRWLAKWNVAEDAAFDITVAVHEACTNAIDHAYGPGGGEFELDATEKDGAIVVSVHDSGGWRDPRGSGRGRGLPIMRALMDSVEVSRREGGTTVVVRRALTPGALA